MNIIKQKELTIEWSTIKKIKYINKRKLNTFYLVFCIFDDSNSSLYTV